MAQGFRFAYNLYGAPERRISHIMANNGESFVAGEAVKLASGRWTKASGTDAVAGFAAQNLSGGNQILEVVQAREGDVWEAPYSGTPDAGFVVGANAVAVATDGLSANSATVSGGALSVIEINTNKKTCRVIVKNRQLS